MDSGFSQRSLSEWRQHAWTCTIDLIGAATRPHVDDDDEPRSYTKFNRQHTRTRSCVVVVHLGANRNYLSRSCVCTILSSMTSSRIGGNMPPIHSGQGRRCCNKLISQLAYLFISVGCSFANASSFPCMLLTDAEVWHQCINLVPLGPLGAGTVRFRYVLEILINLKQCYARCNAVRAQAEQQNNTGISKQFLEHCEALRCPRGVSFRKRCDLKHWILFFIYIVPEIF